MSLAIVLTRARVGVDAPQVTVETHLSNGLPGLSIVGLPEAAVRESKDRVRSALLNAGFEFPARRITINLAPADLPKEGGRFDLAIALGILAASGQIPAEALQHLECLGELALSGELRPITGVLPAALACRDQQRTLLVPRANADEAALPEGVQVLAANHLLEICAHLHQRQRLQPHPTPVPRIGTEAQPDLADVKGQAQAKRALEVAAAGQHNLLLSGPPGTGKTMLARRLPGLLPPMTEAEALASAAVRSLTAGIELDHWRQRPYRAPHHTASAVALVGGGSSPKPGEISLAHHGVLFLDELTEFDRKVLEVLREPLEHGEIHIARAHRQVRFPARFQLVAAMNPCPCGHLGDPRHACRCSPDQVSRYRAKLSGPLLDRIDLQIEVPALPKGALAATNEAVEASAQVRERVIDAHQRQLERAGKPNSQLSTREIDRDCRLTASDQALLDNALEKLGLSARAYHRILKVARTIADLAGQDRIGTEHLMEAIGYRQLDRAQ